MRPLLPREVIVDRLALIFPREVFDTVASNPMAAASVAAMLYIDAVVTDADELTGDEAWARPATVYWMSDAAYARLDIEQRQDWTKAQRTQKKRVIALLDSWGEPFDQWYADGSRETLRDETWPLWLGFGAVRVKPGVKTNSSAGRWALTEGFADLFHPDLRDEDLIDAIEAWRDSHLSPGDKLRIRTAQARSRQQHSVEVNMPDGSKRVLEPGDASFILKGIVEQWAMTRLGDPVVLTISEPGHKILVADSAVLADLGLAINAATLLPDAVIVDIKPKRPEFWIIEAVASDGEINEDRKASMLRWAAEQRIPVESCRFLSAFVSRSDSAARRRLKDLALGTYAWYADEPTRELSWYDLES